MVLQLSSLINASFRLSKLDDLVGDNFQFYNQTTVPDSDPFDNCTLDSSGTHVSGIVGAIAINIATPGFIPPVPFTGVAPEATLGMYRVFGCVHDFTSNDIIAAAIYRAASDGADIISVSIEGGPTYSDEVDAYAATVVGKKGHIVLGQIGDDGAAGLYSTNAPGIAKGGFGVASFDNKNIIGPYLTVDGKKFPYFVGSSNGSFPFPASYGVVVNSKYTQLACRLSTDKTLTSSFLCVH